MRSLTAALLLVLLAPSASAHPPAADSVLYQLQLEQAELRLLHARADLAEVEGQLEWIRQIPYGEEVGRTALATRRFGAASEYRTVTDATAGAERAVIRARVEADLLDLDVLEMRITERLPDRGLFAPLVEGRDIVGERQELRMVALRETLEIVETRRNVTRQLVDLRAVPCRDLVALDREVDVLQDRIDTLDLEINHRAQHLAEVLPADAHFIREQAELDRRQRRVEAWLAQARLDLSEVDPLAGRAYATQRDFDDTVTEVRELAQDLEDVLMERRIVDHRYAKWRERQRSK